MAYDGFLGYINDKDPIPSDIRECIDKFLILSKSDQNTYFSMYDNHIDYCEKVDEFGKIIPYKMDDWIKSALDHIKGFNNDDCTNYALSKSVANIKSFKIIEDKELEEQKESSIEFITNKDDRVPIYHDDQYNRTVYSDGSIIDDDTGEELTSDKFNNIIKEKNNSVTGMANTNSKDKETFDYINKKANPDLAAEKKPIDTPILEEITNESVIQSAPANNIEDETIYMHKGRIDYISWDDFFMGTALLAAKRSKDPITQVGAVIVRNNKIVSTGYNGMPNVFKKGLNDNDTTYPWSKVLADDDPMKDKRSFVVHAELNAILNAEQNVRGCIMYTTLFPCNECAKAIVQSGIKEVVYCEKDEKKIYDISELILSNANIAIRKYVQK